jgi:hypothetical protein
VAHNEHAQSDSPNPDPAVTPGLDAGGGVLPGDTPPEADQMSGATGTRHQTPNQGPVESSRTPMIITLSVLAVIVVMIAVLTAASFFAR